MNKNSFTIPEQRNFEYALQESLEIAQDNLSSADIATLCRKSGAVLLTEHPVTVLLLNYLGVEYRIELPEGIVSPVAGGEELSLRERILVLHYLLTAEGKSLKNEAITFQELPEGVTYYPNFYRRTIYHLVKYFGDNPAVLVSTAAILGGLRSNYGDSSVVIKAFPHVPITLVLWQGDHELNPAGNILFDRMITAYLPLEDIIVLCEVICWRLIKLLKAGS